MKIYGVRIELTGEEVCVAGRTMDHAAEVFVTFWIARSGDAPGKFTIERGPPADYRYDDTVALAIEGDVAGVIVRMPDGSTAFDAAMGC